MLAAGRLGLCDFIFMMRELQILAATMDIKVIAQATGRHCRTLDMPAGPTRTPG